MYLLRKIVFLIFLNKTFKINKDIFLQDLNFRRLDFTNYKQIKSFIFKKDFYKINNRYVQSFDFLNYSKKVGGEIGINLSKNTIFKWYNINKNKFNQPWNLDLTSKRLINIIYNYEFINSSSSAEETKKLNKIVITHMKRVIFEYNFKKINELNLDHYIAYTLSSFSMSKKIKSNFYSIDQVLINQIDILGMHKSYNILEHAKFMNNLNEIKNILLYYKMPISENIEKSLLKMRSILNAYFHKDGSLPLFNGANNNYTSMIYDSLSKEEYLKTRVFSNIQNGIALYVDKNKKIFFDVVQPNKDKISTHLSAGTLSFELSSSDEKIITNCGASESFGKNPEYLRYSAAHSTIVLQNTNISEIKENNPHIKFPQSVKFSLVENDKNNIFEGLHNGYIKKFKKIIKRRLVISKKENMVIGEDSFIPVKNSKERVIFHIRFHLMDGISFNFTNNKKSIILKTKLNNIWIFRSDSELIVEDSILVDRNITIPTKQIVIKGVTNNNKHIRKWSLEKI